ncbi:MULTISPECIES: 50S ribosomal protein L4 [Raineya]|jgi:large subunit ribosomal protein L4|uniref:Large ribosomal subunit protein uL4 n=1 Tax=Raineya orbicola TaxID=2016530 RepID=A0A2N3IDF2_9BACT|nr:50S ribosomal protein L4 [Raineya orbicola]PKQ68308.1 50S ribosomal protein L4 [Raineya orbicola]
MQLPVLNIQGTETGRAINLPDEIFAIEPNQHVVYLDVKHYLAAQRQGTHKSKERNEVHGSTRKLHRQKGTGGSRKGSIKNPLFRHGGRIFGPRPRDYDFKLNKKTKILARKSALTYKAQENAIKVLENFSFDKPKTKEYLAILEKLAVQDKKTLLVLPEHTPNVYLSGRNLPKANTIVASDLNTYAVMNADVVILCEGAVAKIQEILVKE